MRIDTLELRNFKKFEELKLQLHPQFNLLAGENAAGKTTLLDGLAVALAVWLVEVPDTTLQNSRRNILDIGELSREEVLLLTPEGPRHPQVSRGADSNWLLDHEMDPATSENAHARQLREAVEVALADHDFPQAHQALEALQSFMEGGLTSQVVGLESRLDTLETLAEGGPEARERS